MSLIGVVFVLGLVVGVPVAFALGLAGTAYIVFWEQMPLSVIARRMYHSLDSFALLAVPLFILIGDLSDRAGLLDGVLRWLRLVLGRLRGGLAYINVVGSMIFAGVSGTAVSDAASLGRVQIAMMARAGYPLPFSAALTAASSLVGPIIPPSVAMVIFALAAGHVSIGGLFLAGALPGALLGLGFIAISWWSTRKMDLKREYAVSITEVLFATVRAIPFLLLPVIIIGGVVSGLFTVTESAAVGAVYVLAFGFLGSRQLNYAALHESFVYTARMSAVLAMLMGTGGIVSWILTRNQAAAQLSVWVDTLTPDPFLFLVAMAGVLLLLGLIMDATALIVALTPLFYPVAILHGVDPLHFGMVFILTVMVGMATPPVGILLFLVSSIAGISVERLSLAIVPFIVWCILVIGLTIGVPELSLWLPRMFGFA